MLVRMGLKVKCHIATLKRLRRLFIRDFRKCKAARYPGRLYKYVQPKRV